eukprot:CAMPEP_0197292342 /NCGR_PEP_ID=MMETSP0890-20130614/22608_1 /TAXON_ID=44058 ORGANISM="Aureoumbra lagunensis, Strain CCMP1510" /NCGR_SAMPLE_ID=MMETSP0890 /ASSEMBLY_ACC=CAM_ASM_000533 /LENGTH=55 /DNA_ID=CAMNT_0042766149 /DNA_START=70 /DNA_END=237 /DNA_ORIENTATION=-
MTSQKFPTTTTDSNTISFFVVDVVDVIVKKRGDGIYPFKRFLDIGMMPSTSKEKD